jgi:hypothetical protein
VHLHQIKSILPSPGRTVRTEKDISLGSLIASSPKCEKKKSILSPRISLPLRDCGEARYSLWRISEKDLGRVLADGAELAGSWQRLLLSPMSITPGDIFNALAMASLIGCDEEYRRVSQVSKLLLWSHSISYAVRNEEKRREERRVKGKKG